MLSLLMIPAVLLTVTAEAAKPKKSVNPDEFRRSSLTMIMMEDARVSPEIETLVRKGFIEAQVPDKFDSFVLGDDIKIFDPTQFVVTDEARTEYATFSKTKKSKGGKGAKGASIASGIVGLVGGAAGVAMGPSNQKYQNPVIDTTKADRALRAYLYLKENHIAKWLYDQWFSTATGKLSTDEIASRAYYNATPEQKAEAQELLAERAAVDPMGAVMDMGGMDMINNSFVTVSSFRYMTGDEMAAEICNGAAIGAAFLPQQAADAAMSVAEIAGEAAKMAIGKGYCINSTTQLYKLIWNKDVEAAIAQCFPSDLDKYNALDCFHLEYVGESSAYCQVAVGKRNLEEAVAYAVSRSMAKVIAKLEKENEVFRTVTPLTGIDPEIIASIGTKECVEKGDKYDVLANQGKDEEGKSIYKKVGSLTVQSVGNNMGEDNDEEGASAQTYSTFKGKLPKTAGKGTLIRQAK